MNDIKQFPKIYFQGQILKDVNLSVNVTCKTPTHSVRVYVNRNYNLAENPI